MNITLFWNLLSQGYYEVGEKEKARELWNKLARKYQENLTYYSTLDLTGSINWGSEIMTDIERYRSLVDILILNDSKKAREEADKFNKYLMLFKHFYGSPEESEALPASETDLFPQEISDSL